MIEKIISGGQTGADRAALDFAIAHGIPHGGWCPKGRKSDGVIDGRYQLKETPTSDYSQRTEWNVRDSDGTVVFSIQPVLTGGSKKTLKLAQKHGKPVLHLCREVGVVSAATNVRRFVEDHKIKVLNVAGPRGSSEPEIYDFVDEVLMRALAQVYMPETIRVLFSESEQLLPDLIRIIARPLTKSGVTVLTPPSPDESDFLELAAAQQWDFAILFANNVIYESGDRSPAGLERDAADLVGRLVRDFKKPVMVLYGNPDLETFPIRMRIAGASAVLRMPSPIDKLKWAIKRCLRPPPSPA